MSDTEDPSSRDDSPPTAPLPLPGPPVAPSPYPPSPPGFPAYGELPAHGAPGPYGPARYGPQPYGQEPYGHPAYAPPPGAYGPPPQRNGGAVALTVLAGIGTVMCCLLSVPALILGIVALTKQSTDPEGSRRFTRYGWIALALGVAVSALVVVLLFVVGAAGGFDDPTAYDEGL